MDNENIKIGSKIKIFIYSCFVLSVVISIHAVYTSRMYSVVVIPITLVFYLVLPIEKLETKLKKLEAINKRIEASRFSPTLKILGKLFEILCILLFGYIIYVQFIA